MTRKIKRVAGYELRSSKKTALEQVAARELIELACTYQLQSAVMEVDGLPINPHYIGYNGGLPEEVKQFHGYEQVNHSLPSLINIVAPHVALSGLERAYGLAICKELQLESSEVYPGLHLGEVAGIFKVDIEQKTQHTLYTVVDQGAISELMNHRVYGIGIDTSELLEDTALDIDPQYIAAAEAHAAYNAGRLF